MSIILLYMAAKIPNASQGKKRNEFSDAINPKVTNSTLTAF
jgi:hypothetical protein